MKFINFLENIYVELGINSQHLTNNKLARCEQPPLHELEVVEIDHEGRAFILHKTAVHAWNKMCSTAKSENIELRPYSGFRSYLYQRQLIKRKLDIGQSLEVILTETAIPGFSEHHSGLAVDICAEGKFHLNANFEETEAFTWLIENANRFRFTLSYPRDNAKGIVYEPWHWFFK